MLILQNNHRIARNTLILYLRMFFTVAVSLYTSRVVLNTLGVEDYGTYNVVGGIVLMFSFLNAGMVAASQRFISYELGTNDTNQLKKVFSTSVLIHFVIALIIFLLSETIGLWFLNQKMNIDVSIMNAANWVYQCSVLAFLLNIISVPYNACIVAHERMKTYAYVSIYEVCVKLLIVLSLAWIAVDKLKVYAVFMLFLAASIRAIYGVYCKRHFKECDFRFVTDRRLFGEMMHFAGWSFLGNMGFAVKNQGINILINLFFGVTVNAARGVAYTVTSQIQGFVSNFQMAIRPQITKQYASGNVDAAMNLVFKGSRYSFFLLLFIAVPALIKTSYILRLWLGFVPEYSEMFLRMALVMALIDSMAGPLVAVMQANGKIRNFQIIIALIMLLNLPVSYLILKTGGNPYSVMYVAVFTSFIGLAARVLLLNSLVKINLYDYFKNVIGKCFGIFLLSMVVPFVVAFYVNDNFTGLVLISCLSVLCVAAMIFLVGLDSQERVFVKKRTMIFIKKIKNLRLNS